LVVGRWIPVLAGEVVEIEQHIEVVGDLRDCFGPLRAIGRSERLRTARRGRGLRRCISLLDVN
jgi:hypothetical protein